MSTSGGDPRVAVAIITHNRCADLLRSLDHLTRLPERPRIVVVDNGSSDGTAAAVARRFPEVELIDAGGNLGAAGRTLGIRHVDTPYIALCDDDAWWHPGALARAADLFDRHPRLGILQARILVGAEEREAPVCAELAASPLEADPGMPGRPLLGFIAGAAMVRQSAYLEVGGFADRAAIGGEEALLAVDLAARGWWICYAPDLVNYHHPSPVRDIPRRRANQVRNNLWFAWLRRPLLSAARRTIGTARELPWDSASRRGFAAALAGLPWVLRERRVVPPQVERGLRLLDARH